MPRVPGGSQEGGQFLMSEVPLYRVRSENGTWALAWQQRIANDRTPPPMQQQVQYQTQHQTGETLNPQP